MQSRSSSSSRSSQVASTAYFPRAESAASWQDSRSLPVRPRRTEPISDPHLCAKPIAPFDEQTHHVNYAAGPEGAEAHLPVPQPHGFSDPYLMPSLTKNERLRLTMLWYYTKGLVEDQDFVMRLQEKLDLVQTFMGWEFAIIGLVSEDVFIRLATTGLPLAILPRRESTCSHTINQEPGVSPFLFISFVSSWFSSRRRENSGR